MLPLSTVQDMISTAGAHQKILEKHISALQQLMDDESLFSCTFSMHSMCFLIAIFLFDHLAGRHSAASAEPNLSGETSLSSLNSSTIPSIKFHLNLILESSRNSYSSLTQCLTVIAHQKEVNWIWCFHFKHLPFCRILEF